MRVARKEQASQAFHRLKSIIFCIIIIIIIIFIIILEGGKSIEEEVVERKTQMKIHSQYSSKTSEVSKVKNILSRNLSKR